MKKILFVLALSATTLPTSFAGSVDMTCSQAQAHYNKYGRIYVRTGTGDIVPIYGLAQRCGIGYDASPYWVRTYDKSTCVLGYNCYRHDNGHDHGHDGGRDHGGRGNR